MRWVWIMVSVGEREQISELEELRARIRELEAECKRAWDNVAADQQRLFHLEGTPQGQLLERAEKAERALEAAVALRDEWRCSLCGHHMFSHGLKDGHPVCWQFEMPSGFTPGPWTQVDNEIQQAESGMVICTCTTSDDFPCITEDEEQSEAEARAQVDLECTENAKAIRNIPVMIARIRDLEAERDQLKVKEIAERHRAGAAEAERDDYKDRARMCLDLQEVAEAERDAAVIEAGRLAALRDEWQATAETVSMLRDKAVAEAVEKTIERCAKIADEWGGRGDPCYKAIRALKAPAPGSK